MQAKSKRRRQSWPSHQTTPDADSGEIYLVGDSVTSDNLQRKEKTKSCRRGKKNGWRWKKKKKKKEKAAVRGRQQKKPAFQPTLVYRSVDGGSRWGSSSGDLRVWSTYRAGEAKAHGRAGIQDAHRVGWRRGISTKRRLRPEQPPG